MIRAKLNNIYKDLFKKNNFNKKELKKIILKSIIQNNNVQPILRSKCIKKLNIFNLKSSLSKQNNNICVKTGRIKGVYKYINLSRHYIKKLSLNGGLQNVKISSW